MNLYEVNSKISELFDRLEPDPETGEVPSNEDEIIDCIKALAMKREDILRYIAKLSLDTKASIQAMKAEEKRLHDRRMRMENKQQHLISVLDRECDGQNTDLGVATLCYRKTSHVDVTDKEALLSWLRETGHDDCYRIPEPEISKLNVGMLLDAGLQVQGAERVTSISCYLR